MQFSQMRELVSPVEEDLKIVLDRFPDPAAAPQQERALRAVALEPGVAYSTAERWASLYRKFGLSALARKERSDRRQSRAVSQKPLETTEASLRPFPESSSVHIAIPQVSKRWPPNNKTNNIQRHPGISMTAYSL
jgi:hypothetical protein